MGGARRAKKKLLDTVIRRLFGDLHIMHVALAHPGRGDLNELGARAQFLDRAAAAIAHCRSQSARELINDRSDRALVGNHAFDAFRHIFVEVSFVFLEVALSRAFLHRRQTAHAAIALATSPEKQTPRSGINGTPLPESACATLATAEICDQQYSATMRVVQI